MALMAISEKFYITQALTAVQSFLLTGEISMRKASESKVLSLHSSIKDLKSPLILV